jgi:two-component system sensor histidine kinase BaeS
MSPLFPLPSPQWPPVRFGITSKLFGAILVTNIVMATAFGIAMHVTVNRSFSRYVEEREARRLAALAQTLAAAYAEQGGWDFLRRDPARWGALTRPERVLRGAPDGAAPPPHARGAPHVGGPPPAPGAGPPRAAEPGMRGPPPGPPPGPSMSDGALARPPPGPGNLELVDADKARVAGSIAAPGDSVMTQAVVVDGATVGWLRQQAPTFAGSDTRLLEQLLAAGWVVAGLALLVAAAAAIPLARGLLAPIRRLAQATHRLAEGDYRQTIAATSNDELGQLTFDFNRLAATLKDAETARRGFLADVSHELRTPLAVLRAELDALQDGVRAWTPEAGRSLQAEVATLGGLVDDLYDLAVADLGPGALRKRDVDVAQLAIDALGAFEERFAARGLAVDATRVVSPAVAEGDPRRLTQLINNVLENALRYTDPGGRVEVAVRGERDGVTLDVMDSAPGVPVALLPRLFERLFRVEPSRSREFGGAGLGLSVCQSIVRGHGGTIEARTSPLGGIWIHVRLPRKHASEAAGE